jgi:hypothetical protein
MAAPSIASHATGANRIQCAAITRSGQTCKNNTLPGSRFCHIASHQGQDEKRVRGQRWRTGFRRFGSVGSTVGASLALAATLSEVFAPVPVIAAPAEALSLEDPLTTPFEVSNESRFWDLEETRGICHVVEIRGTEGSGIVGGDHWCYPTVSDTDKDATTIKPGKGDRIDCAIPFYLPEGVASADIDVGLKYEFSPLHIEREEFTRFQLFHDDDGKLLWRRKADGRDRGQTRPPDTTKGVEFVRPCDQSVEKMPVTRGITFNLADEAVRSDR